MITNIGNTVSPCVRKILVILTIKGVPFEIDPFVPFFGDEEFSNVSPLRRIPVLIDGETVVNDSSVIAQYLEERYPYPSILPPTSAARAKARWLEEYADTRMGDVLISARAKPAASPAMCDWRWKNCGNPSPRAPTPTECFAPLM